MSELEGDGCAAEGFLRIAAAGLIGIEDGESEGDGVVGLGEVMVSDDEVEAEAAGGFCFGKGSHAGVDGDDEADAFCVCSFKDAGLEAIPLAEAVGDMKPDEIASGACEHFNGGLEQDNGGGAVDVVVAVEEDGFARGDGGFEAMDRSCHAEHEKGIVEEREFRIEEGVCGCGGGNSAGDEELGEDLREASFFCEGFGGWTVCGSEHPALAGELAWGVVFFLIGRSGWSCAGQSGRARIGTRVGTGSGLSDSCREGSQGAYSSSKSSCECASSMTMSWKASMSSSRIWKRSYHSVVVSWRKTRPW